MLELKIENNDKRAISFFGKFRIFKKKIEKLHFHVTTDFQPNTSDYKMILEFLKIFNNVKEIEISYIFNNLFHSIFTQKLISEVVKFEDS